MFKIQPKFIHAPIFSTSCTFELIDGEKKSNFISSDSGILLVCL